MSQKNYDVEAKTVEAFFSQSSISFKIPSFQRPYAWTKDEIGQLLDDIFGDSDQFKKSYFLGSVVLVRQNTTSSDNTLLVLDGQQRISTLTLIIAILISKVENDKQSENDVSDFKSYLFSRKLKGKKTPKIELQPSDAKIFESLIDDPANANKPELRKTTLGIAALTISDLLDYYSITNSVFSKSKEAFYDMLERLMYEVEVIEIITPSEFDAFRLFETLNNRGLELNAGDLIKNKLFSRCEYDLEDVIESWNNLLNNLEDEDIVSFLRTFWISSHGFVRKDKLYDTYKAHIESLTVKDAAVFALELEEAAELHRGIITPKYHRNSTDRDSTELTEILSRLSLSYKVRICRPALLSAAKFKPEFLLPVARLCESITVRYSIVGSRSSNLLESLYANICKEIRSKDFSWETLTNSPLFNDIPSDEEFKQSLINIDIHNPSSAWREILIQLNAFIGHGEAKIDNSTNVNIEHILPQNPSAEALFDSGMTEGEAVQFIPKFGNLTLLSETKNRKISNKSFKDKSDQYLNSDIFLTRELCKFTKWDQASIELRTKHLASEAIKRFPHPSAIKA